MKSTQTSSRNHFDDVTVKILLCSFVVCLSIVSSGSVISYPSPAIPDLNAHPNAFHVSDEQNSWIGGLVPLGAVLGGVLGGPFMDYLGRKLTLLIATLPYAVGWVVVIASTNVPTMYAGRFVTGISLGIASGITHVYIAETAPATLRGALCSLGETFFSLGMIYVYVCGYFLDWQWLAVACLLVVLLNAIGIYFLPETPRWLLSTALQREKAVKILQWLRGPKSDIEAELKEIENSVLNSAKVAPWSDFLKTEHAKNTAICLALFFVQELCGNNVIKMYTVSIFQEAGTELDPNLETIIVGIVAFLGCLVCVVTVDIFGRRLLLIISTAAVAISMITLGAYFKVKDNDFNYAQQHLSWMPLFSLLMNSFFYGIGIGPIPWVLPSELFPTDFRGKANAVCVAWAELCGFIAAKFFVNLSDALGFAGAYWLLAGVGAAGCVISIFAAPETMNKSLEQLQIEIADSTHIASHQ